MERTQNPKPTLVGTTDLASALGITPKTVRRMAQAGRIPSIRVGQGRYGSTYKFNMDAVLAALTPPWSAISSKEVR